MVPMRVAASAQRGQGSPGSALMVGFLGDIKRRVAGFIARLFLAYFIAGFVVAILLVALGKFPLLSDPIIALKRLVVITMPASMGAIIVDGFDTE